MPWREMEGKTSKSPTGEHQQGKTNHLQSLMPGAEHLKHTTRCRSPCGDCLHMRELWWYLRGHWQLLKALFAAAAPPMSCQDVSRRNIVKAGTCGLNVSSTYSRPAAPGVHTSDSAPSPAEPIVLMCLSFLVGAAQDREDTEGEDS